MYFKSAENIPDLSSKETYTFYESHTEDITDSQRKDLNFTFIEYPSTLYDHNDRNDYNASNAFNDYNLGSDILQTDHRKVPHIRLDRSDRSGQSRPANAFGRIDHLKKEIQLLKDEEIQQQKKKKICYCIPSNRRGKIIFLFLLILTLTIIATVVYFLYPR